MKVLHINQGLNTGGAAIAGYRLHQSLLAQGLDSKLMLGHLNTGSNLVATMPPTSKLERQLLERIANRSGLNYLHLISSFQIPHHSFFQAADVLNFHNLHTGYFNYLTIPTLTKNKPAVFTLHDMWSFTGHCAYSYDCDRWKIGCGKCPYPNIYPTIRRDNTRLEWKLKNWLYSRSNLTIITLSHWLTQQVQQSMLNRFPIHHIPNGVDTQVYQPLDPEYCRSALGISPHQQVLMTGADNLKDSRKGGDLLLQALQSLPDALKADCLLLTLGSGGETLSERSGIASLNLGHISNDRLKAVAYSAADLFLFPSRADNLPLVLQESMACGTPMVSCKVGGVPDLVRPGITGYLASPQDVSDFRDGIVQLLEDRHLRQQLASNCREIAITEYPLELQAQRYIKIYQQVLDKG